MVKDCVGKAGGAVADAAVLGSGNMIRRLAYGALSNIVPIVARGAVTRDTHVIEGLRRECRVGMTHGTILARMQMVCSLDQIRIGGEEPAYMTPLATAGDVLMKRSKKRCRGKDSRGVVTDTAITLRRNVINDLGSRDTRGMT